MSRGSAAVDRASERDRQWFEKHPGAGRYIRARVAGEFGPAEDDFPAEVYPWVVVIELRPGSRLRQAFAHLEILSMS